MFVAIVIGQLAIQYKYEETLNQLFSWYFVLIASIISIVFGYITFLFSPKDKPKED